MKNSFLVVLNIILLIFAVGCGHNSCKFVNMPVSLQRPEYSVPVKFYVRDVDVNLTKSNFGEKSKNKIYAGELRDAFAKYYPEIFTDEPTHGLTIEFGMDLDVTSCTMSPAIILPIITYSLCPYINNQTIPVTIRASVVNSVAEDTALSVSGENTIKSRHAVNISWGLIFQTARLVPHVDDAVFYNNSDISQLFPTSPLILIKGREKQFLTIFIEQLYRIPPEKVRELYLAKMTSGIKMKK